MGRPIRTSYANGTSTSTAYDAAGQAIEAIDERGHVQWTAYDAAGRRTSTTDAVGAVTQYAYDAAGNQIGMTDALRHQTRFAYDADNHPVATTYPDGNADSTLYDPDGRMIAKNDTLGRSTEYAYDAVGQLVKVTDALGDVTRYGYDETGMRTSQQDANQHTTTFTYDLVTSTQIGRTLPDRSSESRTDDAGSSQRLGQHRAPGRALLVQLQLSALSPTRSTLQRERVYTSRSCSARNTVSQPVPTDNARFCHRREHTIVRGMVRRGPRDAMGLRRASAPRAPRRSRADASQVRRSSSAPVWASVVPTLGAHGGTSKDSPGPPEPATVPPRFDRIWRGFASETGPNLPTFSTAFARRTIQLS